jgi:UDP-glucose 4-epimerase
VIWCRIEGRRPTDPGERRPLRARRAAPGAGHARRILGFEADTSLEEMLDEVIPWIVNAVENGTI